MTLGAGYRNRTGFLAGLTVAQVSEFSLILGALGLSLGHIDADTMGLITLVVNYSNEACGSLAWISTPSC